MDALITAGVLAGCAIVLLIFGLWRLFDENVAKPLERLSGELRARVHANINTDLEDLDARHLGDLAPAATALMRHLYEARNELAEIVARETSRHAVEKESLTCVLSSLPFGVIVCTADHHLALYNTFAHELLAGNGSRTPCLGRRVFEFLDEAALRQAHDSLMRCKDSPSGTANIDLVLTGQISGASIQAQMRLLEENALGPARRGYVLTLLAPDTSAHGTCSPQFQPAFPGLVYDFELLDQDLHENIADTSMQALSYVVFDTETTGLLPDRGDEIVQLAAVRVVNGRRVQSEVFNTLVNPGRPIPPSSTLIHGITDAMVANAPNVDQVVRDFHNFARGSVLVAHNIEFDMAFLRRAARRAGLRFDHPVLDTAVLSAKVFGDGENHSLDALAARLGVELTPSARHTAVGDATATAEILIKLLPAVQARA